MAKTVVLGVDPGLTGALAWLDLIDGEVVSVRLSDTPTLAARKRGKTKTTINEPELARLIREDRPDVAYVEDVHAMPGQGVASMFTFGYTLGVVAGALAALRVPVQRISPAAWQAATRSAKDQSRQVAIRLFPGYSGLLSRKGDHNRADALLIAWAGWLTM